MPKYKIIRSRTSMDKDVPPLQRLIDIFHQDFGLMRVDPIKAGVEFVESLSEAEKREFRASVIKLLKDYPGHDQKGLKSAWFRLGAGWCGIDLKQALTLWAEVED